MATCPNCTSAVADTDTFCGPCGYHLRPHSPPTLPPPTVPVPAVPAPAPPPAGVPGAPPPPLGAQPTAQPTAVMPVVPAAAGSSKRWLLLGAAVGVAVVGALVTALLVMRSGGGSSASDTTLAPATSVAPATTSVPTTAAPATLAPTTVPATIPATTVAPTTTLPYGLPAVFPNSVPADACTAERIIADTGKTLGFDVFCNGAWSLNVPSPECGEAECESADVYRWTGERWVYRGFYYAYCVSTVSASGMPPAIARDIGAGPCGEEVDLRPEPSAGPLSMNDEGVRVQRLQQALIDRGLLFDDADGQYGPNTQAAVMDLQYFLGIEPDGMAGAEVHAALLLSYS